MAAPTAAQLAPLGFTAERGQWLVNPSPPSKLWPEYFGLALAAGDFDGDGTDDLATGVPDDDNDSDGSGCVVVRYGRPGEGLAEGAPGVTLRQENGSSHFHERFGLALAAGDFDGDGFDDLAVGIPGDGLTPPTYDDARGSVRVYHGSAAGLSNDDYDFLDEQIAEGGAFVCSNAWFGGSLAVGDFDADGHDDLAIGVPFGCELGKGHAGAVYVAHGRAGGLLPFFGYRITQDSIYLYEEAEPGDRFGTALAPGDFDGNGYDDLAIGVPGENDGSGAVQIVFGHEHGLIFEDNVFWLPGALGEAPAVNDHLGAALAAGDFDGDGYADVAVGTPDKDVGFQGERENAGVIDVAYGAARPAEFDLTRTNQLSQGSLYGTAAQDGPLDHFGAAFGAGDFDGDGRDDLVIGHPLDDWSQGKSGGFTVLMGATPSIAESARFHFFSVGLEGVPGVLQPQQNAGWAFAVGDFDGSGRVDLAIGVPSQSLPSATAAGAESILYSDWMVFADGFETGATDQWSWTTTP